MPRVRLAPDLLGLLRLDHLQRDGVHRRNRRELDQPLGLSVTQLPGRAREGVESGDQEPRGALGTGLLGHARIFAPRSDGPLPPEGPCPVPGT